MIGAVVRSRPVLEGVSLLASAYLRCVRATTRFVQEPVGFLDRIASELPVLVAMWHGQHFMIHYAWPPGARIAALISRHRDAELNAVLLERLGVKAIRGSGGRAEKARRRGGVTARLEMVRTLARGYTVVMTADVPKVSRQAGLGIVTLARLSGRPIYPLAVVTNRRFDFKSWDRASLGKPFGRGAMVLGDPILVDRAADEDDQEQARLAVERGLDAVHARAYALVGSTDPGAGRNGAPVQARSD